MLLLIYYTMDQEGIEPSCLEELDALTPGLTHSGPIFLKLNPKVAIKGNRYIINIFPHGVRVSPKRRNLIL